ncbi:MarR family winged helix-turn-helix transcriptional regulator [Aquimarina hainanensis]|uniref:MarR family winged helix-turn-helix transcriptional regulator n=1 Tax=Aquimarina hainanensis TaxID=1578017 RepID=A0ABW5NBG4_9FLAO|nr:MarR family transcriptional regulator [Aquimarina sp. TRL1]QKX06715.1 MarR family transcriptional regulator [Aquimarina sp. TRL1]
MNEYFNAVIEIIRTGHWFTDQISRELKEYQIYEPQFNVLRILRGAGGTPLSVNQILENMIQRSSNVTRIVDKLSSRGLVRRELCSEDRRKMDIVITEKGLALLEKLDKKVNDFHMPMSTNLSKEEANKLKELIIKLKGN